MSYTSYYANSNGGSEQTGRTRSAGPAAGVDANGIPLDPPPPYSEEADNPGTTGINGPVHNTNRISNQENRPARPPRPLTQSHSAQHSLHHYPPPTNTGRLPTSRPSRPNSQGYTYAVNGRLRYPSGYWCEKCNNTGYKLSNGHECGSCFRRFAIPQNTNLNVQYLPPASSSYFPSPYAPNSYHVPPGGSYGPNGSRVMMAGDPSLGGILCGACKGRGYIHEAGLGSFMGSLMGDEITCPKCRGVGRLF
ncbi:uncharacterized protein V1516DRAFT_656959 [Lipomyces oligophaga]|uniref:uncharacterized protein n=1 Tax=Lipomyces oligophaga TaxID=45792 RepID=UPI0034CDB0AE